MAMTNNKPYRKLLEGIHVSRESPLLELWSQAYGVSVKEVDKTDGCGSFKLFAVAATNAACGSEDEEKDDDNDNTTQQQRRCQLEESYQVLRKAGDPIKTIESATQASDENVCVSIPVLEAISCVLQRHQKHLQSIDELLSKDNSPSLAFTSQQPSTSHRNSDKFQKRIERLRLQQEETKYNKLTTNLQDQRQDDDITAKSMTYAASVGLNMVVAPLSFGCFMYFFAGGVMDFVFAWFLSGNSDDIDPDSTRNGSGGGTDIKRVIIGVISGVAMMFIEMILFVIRTHEFEEHNRKKKMMKEKRGKGGVRPFGAYSKDMPAEYYSSSSTAASQKAKVSNDTNQNKVSTIELLASKKNN